MKSLLMRIRRHILRVLPSAISGVVIVWCGFYLLFGESNIFVLRGLKIQEAGLEKAHEAIVADRKAVEDRVVRLRPDSIDWDMVEEEAMRKLGPYTDAEALPM